MKNNIKIKNVKLYNILQDQEIDLNIKNEFIHQFEELYLSTPFGYENSKVYIKENDIVIDCGANMGLFSNYAASKNAIVYSFEPGKTAYNILKKNISFYNNITSYPYAVGNKNQYEDYIECLNIGGSHLEKYSLNFNSGFRDKYQIKKIILDDFFYNKKIDFIKIDTEGSEKEILLGAKNILKKYQPKLAIASYHFYNDKIILTNIIKQINPNYNIIEERDKLFCW